MLAPFSAAAQTYPETRRGDVVETIHGEVIADPYRWLENDVREDAEVAAWVAAQNGVSAAYLAALPGRAAIKARLEALWDYPRFGVPVVRGGQMFALRNSGLQKQAALFVDEWVLIDPNGWAEDGATALAEWAPSFDGRYLLYGVQEGGSDWRELRVRDVATGQDLPDRVKWVKFSGIAWDREGAGIYYSRFEEPAEGAAFQAANLGQSVHYHRLGSDQAEDRLVFSTPERPTWNNVAEVSEDGRWLFITSSEGTDDRYQISIADLEAGEAPRTLIAGLEHGWSLAGSLGQTLYLVTNKGAPRYRLVAMDAVSGAMTEIVGEGEDTLAGAALIGNRLVLETLADARSRVWLHELDGRRVGEVPLPGIGSASGFAASRDGVSYFGFSSFATPGSVWRFEAASNAVELVRGPEVNFSPDDYVVRQIFFASKDGTRVPMFVSHLKSLDLSRPHPALLYGYGGFNVSLPPAFSPSRLAWMEMGGIFVQANIRGGGEYGLAWHDGGRRGAKQNVFDDFIAAAETLIAEGLSSADQLAIQGGSNGGLLVGAVVNQRPELFAAALPAVGVMDMLRFDLFTAGRYWRDDYGDPADAKDFRVLRGYSPLHNIKAGTAYPAILVTTADTDDRVVPGHSFKYAAALQAADLGPKPQLIRIETRAGHGSGKPTDKLIEEVADLWAYAAHFTGLAVESGGLEGYEGEAGALETE